jgi:hypothetical protein
MPCRAMRAHDVSGRVGVIAVVLVGHGVDLDGACVRACVRVCVRSHSARLVIVLCRYYVAPSEYSADAFPIYCSGGGYVLSMDVVSSS